MIYNDSLKDYAQNISTLTFEMEKVCRTKEVLFCDSINITPVEFRCLRYLLNSSFALAKDLAQNMDLTPSRVTNLLNSLEKKGYVIREISSKDRRVININLTQVGQSFAEDIQSKYVKFHENILLTIEDETQLKEMLCSLKSFQQILENFLNHEGENKNGRK